MAGKLISLLGGFLLLALLNPLGGLAQDIPIMAKSEKRALQYLNSGWNGLSLVLTGQNSSTVTVSLTPTG